MGHAKFKVKSESPLQFSTRLFIQYYITTLEIVATAKFIRLNQV